MTLVVTMPGKMGDVLLSMPIVRELCARTRDKAPALVVTSAYCAPVAPLLERLPYVAKVCVVPEPFYRIEHAHFGAQPWLMPIPAEAPTGPVYHLGFRRFPFLGQSVPELAGEPYGVTPPPGPWLPLVRVDPRGPVAMPAMAPGWMIDRVIESGREVRAIGGSREIAHFHGTLTALGRAGFEKPNHASVCVAHVDDYLGIHTRILTTAAVALALLAVIRLVQGLPR